MTVFCLPEASSAANNPSSRWPRPHPDWLSLRTAFTLTYHQTAPQHGWQDWSHTNTYGLTTNNTAKNVDASHHKLMLRCRDKMNGANQRVLDEYIQSYNLSIYYFAYLHVCSYYPVHVCRLLHWYILLTFNAFNFTVRGTLRRDPFFPVGTEKNWVFILF